MASHEQCDLTYAYDTMPLDELRLAYLPDRLAFVRLVETLGLHPESAMRIVAFWRWLELCGFGPAILRTLSPDVSGSLFSSLAKEAVRCLNFLATGLPPVPYLADEFQPLHLPNFLYRPGFSLAFVAKNKESAINCTEWLVTKVYRRAFSDDVADEPDDSAVQPSPCDLRLCKSVLDDDDEYYCYEPVVPGSAEPELASSGSVEPLSTCSASVELSLVELEPSSLGSVQPEADEAEPAGSPSWRDRALLVPQGFLFLCVWLADWVTIFVDWVRHMDNASTKYEE